MRKLTVALSLAVLALGTIAWACNVPVFRYALERWLPDPYEAVVFHRGPLSAADQELVKLLTDAEDQGRSNLRLNLVDLDKEPDELLVRLYRAQPEARLPWLMVRYPDLSGNPATVWSGPLTAAGSQMLMHSPARKEIARRLTAGDSAVWVLLESGDRQQDDAAARLIEAKLRELPGVLKLPELTDDPEDKLQSAPPLKIAFSMLRLSRRDPAERCFVRMLLNSEDDLEERRVDPVIGTSLFGMLATPGAAPLAGLTNWQGQRVRVEPMLFPVFGRGRALFAWVGKGISADHIEEDARFLIGPCSCTVKRMNPGFDLLLTAEWDRMIQNRVVAKEEPPQLVGLSSLGQPPAKTDPSKNEPPPTVVTESKPPPAVVDASKPPPVNDSVSNSLTDTVVSEASPPPGNRSDLLRNLLFMGLAGLVVLAAATILVKAQTARNQ